MATGHILPGYGDPVTRLRRVRSAGFPLDSRKLAAMGPGYEIDGSEFDRIREQARYMWLRRDREPTTYHFHYSGQDLPPEEKTVSRPTEPTRKNKPHPPHVFLTNRLHYIDGYHNPDTTLGKPCYRIDASLPPEDQHMRRQTRRKYIGHHSSSLLSPYKDQYGVRGMLAPEEAQAAEAWLKVADDKDKDDVMMAIQKHREQEERQAAEIAEDNCAPTMVPRSRTAYPALNRYMKYAGVTEADNIRQSLASTMDYMGGMMLPPHAMAGYRSDMRARDLDAIKRVRVSVRNSRGDFLLHPDWPPSLLHHRIP